MKSDMLKKLSETAGPAVKSLAAKVPVEKLPKPKVLMAGGAVLIAVILVFTGIASCSKKDKGAAASGGASGGAAKASKSQKKATPASDFTYDLTADGKGVVITGYNGEGGDVVIPSEIDGMPVTEIAGGTVFSAGAFGVDTGDTDTMYNRSKVKSIVIPDSVTTIGMYAFAWLRGDSLFEKSLTSITLPKGLSEIPFGMCWEQTNLSELNNVPDSAIFVFDNSVYIPTSVPDVETVRNDPDTIRITKIEGDRIDFISKQLVGYNNTNGGKSVISGPGDNKAFKGCGKLPLPVRKKLQDMGYVSGF